MMLRLILVGLVTSMGFQLPSSRDMSCWAESGRAWASATIHDMGGAVPTTVAVVEAQPETRPEPAAATVAVAPAAADEAFAGVVAGMAADFAADRALALGVAPAAAEDHDGATVAIVEVAEVTDPTVALPAGEESATVVAAEVAVVAAVESTDCEGLAPAGPAEVEAVAVVAAEEAMGVEDDSPTRADRLADAVRLTRQAAQAWADLMAEPADEAVDAR